MASIFKKAGADRRSPWQIEYTDHSGIKRRVSARTADKSAAQAIARDLETRVAQRRAGLIDDAAERFTDAARAPIGEHVQAFLDALRAKGVSVKHWSKTSRYLPRMLAKARIERLAELSPGRIVNAVGLMRDTNLSAKSIGHYVAVVKQFARWLVAERLLAADPLVTVSKPNAAVTGGECGGHLRRTKLDNCWRRLNVVQHFRG